MVLTELIDRVWQVFGLPENIQGYISGVPADVPTHVLISGC